MTDHYATVGGGQNNRAVDGAVSTGDQPYATVGGGTGNRASGDRTIHWVATMRTVETTMP